MERMPRTNLDLFLRSTFFRKAIAANMSKELSPTDTNGSICSQKNGCVETIEESVGYDAKQTKTLLRKMDKALLPFLALLYLLSFLDRANIGNARLAGLEASLGMNGKYDYSVCSEDILSLTQLRREIDCRVHILPVLCRR